MSASNSVSVTFIELNKKVKQADEEARPRERRKRRRTIERGQCLPVFGRATVGNYGIKIPRTVSWETKAK